MPFINIWSLFYPMVSLLQVLSRQINIWQLGSSIWPRNSYSLMAADIVAYAEKYYMVFTFYH